MTLWSHYEDVFPGEPFLSARKSKQEDQPSLPLCVPSWKISSKPSLAKMADSSLSPCQCNNSETLSNWVHLSSAVLKSFIWRAVHVVTCKCFHARISCSVAEWLALVSMGNCIRDNRLLDCLVNLTVLPRDGAFVTVYCSSLLANCASLDTFYLRWLTVPAGASPLCFRCFHRD